MIDKIKNAKLELVVVMPAYNEEECIAEVCTQWLSISSQFSQVRLLVVNDGSKDSTGSILDGLAKSNPSLIVLHQQNKGHGRALSAGYSKALELGCEWVFHVDSDGQFSADDFEKLWKCRARSSFILGYRKKRHDPIHRLIITRLIRFLILSIFGCYIRDANVPFRLIRANFLSKLFSTLPPDVFAPNIFLSILAKKSGENLCEVPVQHLARQTGTVSIIKWKLIQVCFRSLLELIRFRLSLSNSVWKIKGV